MTGQQKNSVRFRAGAWVRVRSAAAIVATLDENGRLDGLPFMPEMFAFCGERFRVWKRAHKTCDTVHNTGGRRLAAAVHLEGVRCDGAAHGDCQAACLIFWKTAWLEPDDPARTAPQSTASPEDATAAARVRAVTRAQGVDDASPTYVCQATRLPEATTALPWWDLRQYVEDFTSGNVMLRQLVSGAAYVLYYAIVRRVAPRSSTLTSFLIAIYDRFQSLIGGSPYPRKWGRIPIGVATPSRQLNLEPGDVVRVRSHEEILSTLDANNKNKGLYFDAEEVPYCGGTFRVRSAITQFIDERTGKMIRLKDRNVILEDVYCQARYSDRRMFCPRAIYPFWRETWLEPAHRKENPDGPRGGSFNESTSVE